MNRHLKEDEEPVEIAPLGDERIAIGHSKIEEGVYV